MKRRLRHLRACAVLVLVALVGRVVSAHDWPQWRGAQMNGTSPETNLPVTWSTTDNIDWKLPLPSWSAATPVIWGDSVFLHVADGDQTFLWRVDRASRTVLWKQNVTSVTSDNKLIVPGSTRTVPRSRTPSARRSPPTEWSTRSRAAGWGH